MDGRLPQGPGPPGPEPEPPQNPKYQPIGAECASLPTITAVAAPASRLGAPHHPMRLRKRFNGIVESLLKKYPTTPEGNLEPVDHTLGAPPAIASGPGVVSATTGVETTPKKKKKNKKNKKKIQGCPGSTPRPLRSTRRSQSTSTRCSSAGSARTTRSPSGMDTWCRA